MLDILQHYPTFFDSFLFQTNMNGKLKIEWKPWKQVEFPSKIPRFRTVSGIFQIFGSPWGNSS